MSKATWQFGALVLIPVFYSMWNILRTVRTLLDWQALVEYGAPAAYILSSGIAWSLAGLFLLWGIATDWPHTPRAIIGISVLYWVWYWADRLLVQQTPAPNMLFSAIFSVLVLLVVVLLWSSPDTKAILTKEKE